MKHVTYTCDMCGKTATRVYQCCMSFIPDDEQDTAIAQFGRTDEIDACIACLKKLKKLFKQKKTASGKEIPEAEA